VLISAVRNDRRVIDMIGMRERERERKRERKRERDTMTPMNMFRKINEPRKTHVRTGYKRAGKYYKCS
jgi:hypothetical protein